jgi:hypothetical protein
MCRGPTLDYAFRCARMKASTQHSILGALDRLVAAIARAEAKTDRRLAKVGSSKHNRSVGEVVMMESQK